MLKNLFTLLSILAVFVSLQSFAGEQTGKISKIIVRASDNLHYFILEGGSVNKPACALATYWMIKDESSAAGKTQISMLLSAHAQQKTIRVVGTDTCTRWSDGEDVNVIFLD